MTRTHSRIATLATLTACLAATNIYQPARAQAPGSQLSDEQKLLQKDVGTWDAAVKLWPVPNAKPIESKAVEKNELLPGGLWLVSRFDGDFGGMKFAGIGTVGYDPVEKKYVGTWIDNMTPHLTVIKADYDPATKTMTGIGQGRDAATGKESTTKNVTRYLDDNTRVFEMFASDPDGKEFKLMEITYKRRAQ
jgi:hypothetical protein